MSTLHRLTTHDIKYCDNRHRAPFTGLKDRFNKDTASHQMSILHDDGLYRHLRFKNPEDIFYWFDLITWPGNLTITGDMGTYTFARLRDMFEFFTGYINTDYWAEKLKCGTSGGRSEVRNHDETLFKKWVLEDFWETSRELNHEETTIWWQSLRDWIFADYSGTDPTDANDCIDTLLNQIDAPRGHYQDLYEMDWCRYDFLFEWCLAAIVTGIRTYQEHTE